ncbi:hypothetical protein [Microbacterium sp. RU33B]|uniref:hypothetical protein n=1 Tax=Microbacterium sp. RU33B TaxID=1907390 RepID=UPI00095A9EAC|nr:hypothetical protein [Microbacterium sp. RU33B]SIT84256.1 hypothetical protein SAMN05880545_2167 [Microbacterium sp. RU33B]
MKRARILWITAGASAVVALIVGVLIAAALQREDATMPDAAEASTSSASPSPVPVATLPAAAVEGDVEPGSDASSIVVAPVAALNQALTDPTVPVDLSMVADGVALADFRDEVEQTAMEGWRIEGETVLISALVVSRTPDSDPPSMVVDVCLDRSGVTVLDTQGMAVPNAMSPTRVLTRWTMSLLDGSWKATNRTFTDEPEC